MQVITRAHRLMQYGRCGMRISETYVDEVQDQTQSTLQLALFVNSDPNGLFLAGTLTNSNATDSLFYTCPVHSPLTCISLQHLHQQVIPRRTSRMGAPSDLQISRHSSITLRRSAMGACILRTMTIPFCDRARVIDNRAVETGLLQWISRIATQ